MQWRSYTPERYADCLGIVHTLVPEFIAPEEIKDVVRFLENLEQWDCRYGVVVSDDEVIACGGLGVEGTVATLCWGLVRADWHRRRVGTFMLQERLRWAQAMPEIETVALETSQHTFGFFERFGFETTRVRKDHFTAGLDAYDMVKQRPFWTD